MHLTATSVPLRTPSSSEWEEKPPVLCGAPSCTSQGR